MCLTRVPVIFSRIPYGKQTIFFLIFFPFVELKTGFDQRLSEKEAELEQMRNDWETKLNLASEDHNNEVTTLISNHGTQLSNYRELHEAALETLEREKSDILEGK